ncbi:MAG: hydroxypyruvate isomerase [Patescibacteria group bacterium]|jgi:hydroxypyruvate isomerase
MKRRNFIKNSTLVGLALSSNNMIAKPTIPETGKLKGNIQHSISRWCFGKYSLEELIKGIKDIGFSAIDLVGPKDWDLLKAHGIDSSMCNGAELNLKDGFNDKKFHEELVKRYTEMIPMVAKAGYKNLICFSGNSRGMSNEKGLANCVVGLKKIIGLAEKHGVVLQMELFNTKVDHPHYMCRSTEWGVALCEALGSEHFKLLYDIYHMQIEEGNVIATIRENHQYFGHYHSAGVPGRNEINDGQELNYPAIMKAVLATGFKGYVAQEFIPTYDNPFDSLNEAISICDL